jgi:hypothetical protein
MTEVIGQAGENMLEVLATLIVLAFMFVPGLNTLVGSLAWGLPGFVAGLALSFAIPLMFWVGLRM